MKIYLIAPKEGSDVFDTIAQRDALGREIASLASGMGVPVFFHDYTRTVIGKDPEVVGPVILLECPFIFMEVLRHMPGFHFAYELPDDSRPTGRSAWVQEYFSKKPASPRKGPAFGP